MPTLTATSTVRWRHATAGTTPPLTRRAPVWQPSRQTGREGGREEGREREREGGREGEEGSWGQDGQNHGETESHALNLTKFCEVETARGIFVGRGSNSVAKEWSTGVGDACQVSSSGPLRPARPCASLYVIAGDTNSRKREEARGSVQVKNNHQMRFANALTFTHRKRKIRTYVA
ncbi:hypothetical protein Naga_100764g4 [Nannochloropsis gaditana]|uniref:Uncharacterized protein n=1 Tax=Nannochloropsis gaditana TaxID=72520 RepID=W7TQ99_9STRA|nr:hypothetical protein Naga_100764g4 [Nannochloropsis gaditana]